MKRLKNFHFIARTILISILLIILNCCATSRNARLESKRQGLMLMDKSEYTMNKGRFKATKSYKVKKKRRKRHYRNVYRK